MIHCVLSFRCEELWYFALQANLPRLSMTLEKWGDPFLLGSDQPFLKGHGESRCVQLDD